VTVGEGRRNAHSGRRTVGSVARSAGEIERSVGTVARNVRESDENADDVEESVDRSDRSAGEVEGTAGDIAGTAGHVDLGRGDATITGGNASFAGGSPRVTRDSVMIAAGKGMASDALPAGTRLGVILVLEIENGRVMLALHFDGKNVSLAERPDPTPTGDEVVVRVLRAGICNTDLEIAKGYMGFQGVLGHELLGVAEGSRVSAEINFSCLACPACQRGDKNHCPTRSVLGILGHDGALAEKVAIPRTALHEVPAGVGDEAAAFAEPLAAALHVLDDLSPGRGDEVAVIGDGKLGLLCAMVLATTQARVRIVGHHLDHFARVRGTLGMLEKDVKRERRFDAVVEATGSPAGLELALATVRPRGTVILKSTYAGKPGVALAPIVIDEVRVVGSRCGSIRGALRALAERLVDPTPLLHATLPLGRALDAFRIAGERGILKVVLAPDVR
jgi:threonine dehydrogenase-like Zn-dependent dehydrogenase